MKRKIIILASSCLLFMCISSLNFVYAYDGTLILEGTGASFGLNKNLHYRGIIKDLVVTSFITSAYDTIGGTVGISRQGTIENCDSYVKITSSGSKVGRIIGTLYTNGTTIKNCMNYGDIIITNGVLRLSFRQFRGRILF